MSEQRRVFLAVSACFLIFVGWQALMAKYYPAPPVKKEPQVVSAKPSEKVVSANLGASVVAEHQVDPGMAAEVVGPETTHVLRTPLFEAVLGSDDASLRSFSLKEYRETTQQKKVKESVNLVTSRWNGLLRQAQIEWGLGQVPRLKAVSSHASEVVFEGVSSEGLLVQVRVSARSDAYALDYALTVRNSSGVERAVAPSVALSLTPQKHASDGFFAPPADQIGGVCGTVEGLERKVFSDVDGVSFEGKEAQWVALDRQYFVASVLPGVGFKHALCRLEGVSQGTLKMVLGASRVVVKPQDTWRSDFTVYIGPKKDALLKKVSPLLLDVIDYNIWHIPLGFLARPMVFLLNVFHTWTSSWGVAIILLTLLVKAALFPVTFKSVVSMRKMQLLKPELDKIKAQFAKDPQRQQTEQLKLFKEKGVNPLGGCLPMLLQMPVWFALYRMLWSSVDLYQQAFLWLPDLTAKEAFPVMAVAVGGLTFLQQKLTPTSMDSQQAKLMLWMMPAMLTAFMVALPSGLVLYTLVNTVLTIIQQLAINKHQIEA